MTGEFLNREEFLIKNISMGGFNLISNYPPIIGDSYRSLIRYGRRKARLHRQDHPFPHPALPGPAGRDFPARGGLCHRLPDPFQNDFQKNLILGIIQNECGIPAAAATALAGLEMAVAV